MAMSACSGLHSVGISQGDCTEQPPNSQQIQDNVVEEGTLGLTEEKLESIQTTTLKPELDADGEVESRSKDEDETEAGTVNDSDSD